MKIKAVIFDLDQTLLDRDGSLIRFLQWQYADLNLMQRGIDQCQFIDWFLLQDHNGQVWKDQVYQHLIDHYKLTEITWQDLLDQYVSQFNQFAIEVPGAAKLLGDLKNKHYKLAIVTNGPSPFQEHNIAHLGFDRLVDATLVSEAVGCRKPSPEIFHLVCRNLGIAEKEAVFVGDHPISDIQGASDVGMTTAFRKTKHFPACDHADFAFEALSELHSLIETLHV